MSFFRRFFRRLPRFFGFYGYSNIMSLEDARLIIRQHENGLIFLDSKRLAIAKKRLGKKRVKKILQESP